MPVRTIPFLEAVTQLGDSKADDAIIDDPVSGRFLDPSRRNAPSLFDFTRRRGEAAGSRDQSERCTWLSCIDIEMIEECLAYQKK